MAVGTYDANGIWHYGESDNIAPFSATLNKLADSASSAITAAKARLATLEASSLSGFIPLTPASIDKSGGTAGVNTLGIVSFNGVSYISLNGILTPGYKNYKLIINATCTLNPGVPALRLRLGGSDSTGGSYNYSGYSARNTGAFGAWNGNANTTFDLGRFNTTPSAFVVDLFQPNQNAITNITIASACSDNVSQLSVHLSGLFNGTTQFDGFTFFSQNGGTIEGTIQVLGIND